MAAEAAGVNATVRVAVIATGLAAVIGLQLAGDVARGVEDRCAPTV